MGRVTAVLLVGVLLLGGAWWWLDDPDPEPPDRRGDPAGASASPVAGLEAGAPSAALAAAAEPLTPPRSLRVAPLVPPGPTADADWRPRRLAEEALRPADPRGPLLELSHEIRSCDAPPVETRLVLFADGRVERRVAVGGGEPALLDEGRLEPQRLRALLAALNATGVLGGDVDLLGATPLPEPPRASDDPGQALTRLVAHLVGGPVRASGLDVAGAGDPGSPAQLAALARAEDLVWQAAR